MQIIRERHQPFELIGQGGQVWRKHFDGGCRGQRSFDEGVWQGFEAVSREGHFNIAATAGRESRLNLEDGRGQDPQIGTGQTAHK